MNHPPLKYGSVCSGIDVLADNLYAEKKTRAAFKRDIVNKVLFVKEGELLFLKNLKLKRLPKSLIFLRNCAQNMAPILRSWPSCHLMKRLRSGSNIPLIAIHPDQRVLPYHLDKIKFIHHPLSRGCFHVNNPLC
ncbi:hypothetical protein [Sodalis ligni]|uniref:Uncharacterized protein n=1 Tax=Sodalis ligni TaxID=2697027 RepID=A0A4R1N581_9GAMM|nr:hypothetical protein [Sodalis ligni]TCL02202.1 hypothetical protein EZJ58_0201 [Sodalis ligni]